jgi:hypothetical protein
MDAETSKLARRRIHASSSNAPSIDAARHGYGLLLTAMRTIQPREPSRRHAYMIQH